MPGVQKIGKIGVEKKTLRIEELSDRVKIAVELYNAAQGKFDRGQDSLREWENIIKVLNAEVRHIQRFVAIAYHNMGVVQAQQEDLFGARKLFECALEIDPEYAMAYYNLAVVHKKLGDAVKAKQLYQKARSLGYEPK